MNHNQQHNDGFLNLSNTEEQSLPFINKPLPLGCDLSNDTDSFIDETNNLLRRSNFSSSSSPPSSSYDESDESHSSDSTGGYVKRLPYSPDPSPRKQSSNNNIPHLILCENNIKALVLPIISPRSNTTLLPLDNLTQRSKNKELEKYRLKVESSIDFHFSTGGRLISQGIRLIKETRKDERVESIKKESAKSKNTKSPDKESKKNQQYCIKATDTINYNFAAGGRLIDQGLQFIEQARQAEQIEQVRLANLRINNNHHHHHDSNS